MVIPNQFFFRDETRNIDVFMKREDLIHPFVSGNKFRKLKYNLLQAKADNHSDLLTFGGAFSNHIAAVAFAGKENGFNTIGIIRGEELSTKIAENPTLQFAQDCGMQLQFVSRSEYRKKNQAGFLSNLEKQWGRFYLIPEGGTNLLAIKGCQEIIIPSDIDYDFVCCAVGTGGTISGICNSVFPNQKVLGFPALKGDFLKEDIRKFAATSNWELINDYHFGGYGKANRELISFLNQNYKKTNIPLDPIYTGKMMFGIIDLIQKDYFPEGSKILAIHTGGIQGIAGMNIQLTKKNASIIQL